TAAVLLGVGRTVRDAVRDTRRVVRSNTNLGMILLLAPLAAVEGRPSLRAAVGQLLPRLGVEDTRLVYEAIRLANPAGLGRVEDQDVSAEPTLPLREVMALAADRDLVARQYANGFREVFDDGVPALVRGLETTACLEGAIIFCHLSLMAAHPDSLIARKRGPADAEEASRRARAVLDSGWPHAPGGGEALARLDDWLRGAGRGRNPGTTADLVTASLFVALREQVIKLPPAYPWTLDLASDMKNGTLPPPGRP
ncbi:MAG TPA: triphosphoribosyl-dephospho-CoA synthase, partial [Gemmataceae bacterium]|nr:triphosphoribosyl-dephospho-CoA synthase [Gemmataceae bacterium]